jgi:hypothetical protein
MKIFAVVMTHKEALPTVKRHLPIWMGVSNHLIFTSPEDSYMSDEEFCLGYPEIKIGRAEHHGEISAQRIISIFNYVIEHYLYEEITHILLMEYDSFAIAIPEDVIPKESGVSAIKYPQNKPIKYKAGFYLHYPMLFSIEGFKLTAKELENVKTKDRHFSDRFIGMAVEKSRISVTDIRKSRRGYSKNTIESYNYQTLREAVKNGAVFFHGVKTVETLSQIYEIPTIPPIQ